ncbi:MAG: DUF4139 domain-containing protein [Verrucomicrobiota bacterium]
MIRKFILFSILLAVIVLPTFAKVDLVTLPSRDTVQLTIYNSADLTLVRESRLLTLKKGDNRLQFSWANTLIDPTSLELMPKEHADKIQIADLAYPPRVQNLGVWTIQSELSGKVPVEITYLTSGLSWRAFYLGILDRDEQKMHLEAYVRVTNQSGEDYENAQTRLIVGTIHILDQIAELARRQYPYGRPNESLKIGADLSKSIEGAKIQRLAGVSHFQKSWSVGGATPKEIIKEGLSEYFIYTIEGTETIPTGWSKRLPSFVKDDVPVVNLYKFEEQRFGKSVVRFLSFKNDKKHRLGDTPIPGGTLRAFRKADDKAAGLLTYEGQSTFKYIPVDQDVELNMGPVANVIVEPKVMNFKTDNFMFNKEGNVAGWDEIREVKIEVKNTRPLPVKVEITRNFPVTAWDLKKDSDCGDYQKVDLDTVKFTLTLKAQTKKEFRYTLTTRHGTRAE